MTEESGLDRRGLWVEDLDAGFSLRLGAVGGNLAQDLAPHNPDASRQALSRPHAGLWFSKVF
ncbi:MAG: hypothetical protein LUE17_13825 [Planctomycetaceae bacterium]|nr:hypothetical protein [Planctomycetaceae bacterium]